MESKKLLKKLKDMSNNKNIIFEGTEGVGKSYLSETLANYLGYRYYKSKAETMNKKEEFDNLLKQKNIVADRLGVISSYILSLLNPGIFLEKNFQSLYQTTPDVWKKMEKECFLILMIATPSKLLERILLRGDEYFNISELKLKDWNSMDYKKQLERISIVQERLSAEKEQQIYFQFFENIQTHMNVQLDLDKWVNVVENSDYLDPKLLTFSEAKKIISENEIWKIKIEDKKISKVKRSESQGDVTIEIFNNSGELEHKIVIYNTIDTQVKGKCLYVTPSSGSNSIYTDVKNQIVVKNVPGKFFEKIQNKNLKIVGELKVKKGNSKWKKKSKF